MQSLPEQAMVVKVEEAEMDEMWSFVQSKKQQRWLWHAIDHRTGAVLAYVLAPHTDAALEQLQQLLAPFSIRHDISTQTFGVLTCDCYTHLSTSLARPTLRRLSVST